MLGDLFANLSSRKALRHAGFLGTRAWVVLFIGRDTSEPLFLQCKEAQRSVRATSTCASLWDWKGSADPSGLLPSSFDIYARLSGRVLARAHARSGDRIAIAAYLGHGEAFDKAVASLRSSTRIRTSATTRRWSQRSRPAG